MSLKKKLDRTSILLLALVLLVPTSAYSGWQLAVHAGAAITPGPTYGPGDVDSYSYIIYSEGSNFYSKNGTTHAVTSSTNSSALIMNAWNTMPTTGTLRLLGSIAFANTLTLDVQASTSGALGMAKSIEADTLILSSDVDGIKIYGGGSGTFSRWWGSFSVRNYTLPSAYSHSALTLQNVCHGKVTFGSITQSGSWTDTSIAINLYSNGAGGEVLMNDFYGGKILGFGYGVVMNTDSPATGDVSANRFYGVNMAWIKQRGISQNNVGGFNTFYSASVSGANSGGTWGPVYAYCINSSGYLGTDMLFYGCETVDVSASITNIYVGSGAVAHFFGGFWGSNGLVENHGSLSMLDVHGFVTHAHGQGTYSNMSWVPTGLSGEAQNIQITVYEANIVVYVHGVNATHIRFASSVVSFTVYWEADYYP